MDGIEWREGITRCPEHDVDLVDDPPEVEEARPGAGRPGLGGLPGAAAVVVALAGIVYAVAGAAFNLWAALAYSREWSETGAVTALGFAQSASWAIGIGAFGCLAAAVLAKAYTRLTAVPAARPDEDDYDDEDEDELPPESGDWFMTSVSTLTICFALAWIGIAIALAWKSRDLTPEAYVTGTDDGYGRLLAYQSAAAACTLGSLAVMGSLLMARAHDRLAGVR